MEHKFYKGTPHPYDESLPSFAAINVSVLEGTDPAPKLVCEFIAVAPDPKPNEDTYSYRWKLLVEQITVLPEDTLETVFPRAKKLAEERVRIACVFAAQPTRDTMVFSAGNTFRLNTEITEEQFIAIIGRCAFEDPTLIDGMIEKSKCVAFQNLVARLK